MKFYRNHWSKEGGSSAGYTWHTSKAAAEKEARAAEREGGEPMHEVAAEVHVTPTKRGILHTLNVHASHADNG